MKYQYSEPVYDKLTDIIYKQLIFHLNHDEYVDVYRDELRDGTVPDYEAFSHLREQFHNGEISKEGTLSLLQIMDGKPAKDDDNVSSRIMDIAYNQILSPEALDEDEYQDLYLNDNPGKILDYDTFDELRNRFFNGEMASEDALFFLDIVDCVPENEMNRDLSDLGDALSDLESRINTTEMQQ